MKDIMKKVKLNDKQIMGAALALSCAVTMKSILKSQKEIVKIVVPKNAELFILMKGGK